MVEIKMLAVDKIISDMLFKFKHHQIIDKKYVNKNNMWEEIRTDEIREWNEDKRVWITEYFLQQIKRGGSVIGAYDGNRLVGFCCLDGYLCGESAKYANITMLFVDDDYKRKGIGKALFRKISECAIGMGAEKMFISAIPSVETVTFYFSMGCIDAKEIISEYIDTEKDRYLEYILR